MSVESQVGPVYQGDGQQHLQSLRVGQHAELIVSQAHGKYKEPTVRGNMFSGSNTSVQTVSALGTTPWLVLYNPVGNTKRAIIKKVQYAGLGGTQPVGAMFHCGFTFNGPLATQTSNLPTGTALTPSCLDIGNAATSTMTLLSAATLHAQPAILYPFAQLNGFINGTSAQSTNMVCEDVDGNIVLEPGAGYCMFPAGAGTSPTGHSGIIWEEEGLTS